MPATATSPADQTDARARPDHEVVIVGNGFSGIGAAIKLKEAGIEDFVVFDKADAVAGTWRENTYPGCACDVPSHMYSFSFEQNPDWSEMYAPQQEIRDYLERVTDKYGVRPHLRFGFRAVSAEWDEAAGLWRCVGEGPDGRQELTARFLISGIGGLHVPAKPHLQGLESFEGAAFHSAEWDHSVDLKSKKVAVIGTGASAIQFVPEIAGDVAQLDLYQRTAPWVLPEARPPHPEVRAPALPPLPVSPARVPPRPLLVPRARHVPRRSPPGASAACSSAPASRTSSAR